MQMNLFLISQGSNYGYNLVDGFQGAFSQIIDFFFFCIIVFLAVLEKQNQSHSNRTKKMEWLIQTAFLPVVNIANQIKKINRQSSAFSGRNMI